jgi:hypothetical protein
MKVTVTLDAAGYEEQFPHPLLLLAPAAGMLDHRVHTQLVRVAEGPEAIDRFNEQLLDFVPLWPNPRPGREFPRKIFLGRDAQRDFVLQHTTISSRHACLYLDEARAEWMLVDSGSTNGTQVRGKALSPGVPAPLRDGDVLSFGKLDALFFTPAGAYRFLRQFRLFWEAMKP